MRKLEIKSPRHSFAGRIAVMTALALPACADTSALDALIASQQNAADGSVDRADAVINGDTGDAGRMDNDADSAVAPVDNGLMNDAQDAGIPEDVQVLPDVQTVDMPIVMVDGGMGTDVVDAGAPDVRTDTGVDGGFPVDTGTDSGTGTCQPTSLAIGLRIGATNVVNTNRPQVTVGYTGDCSALVGRSVGFRSVLAGFPYNQDVTMTTVDPVTHTMRGVLDFSGTGFAGYPMERADAPLEAAVNGNIVATTFNRDVVPPIIGSMTRILALQAGTERYRFMFNGNSIGKVYINMTRVRDNAVVLLSNGTLNNCVNSNVVSTCGNDSFGEEQICHYTVSGSNACVSRRLVFDVNMPGVTNTFTLPDGDYRNAIGMTALSDSVRVDVVYCDEARNCVSTSPVVSRE